MASINIKQSPERGIFISKKFNGLNLWGELTKKTLTMDYYRGKP